MSKKIVHYYAHADNWIKVGGRAAVLPSDHPIQGGYINEIVATSTVLAFDSITGTFETENSIYMLVPTP
jgi:hypothetical protein